MKYVAKQHTKIETKQIHYDIILQYEFCILSIYFKTHLNIIPLRLALSCSFKNTLAILKNCVTVFNCA